MVPLGMNTAASSPAPWLSAGRSGGVAAASSARTDRGWYWAGWWWCLRERVRRVAAPYGKGTQAHWRSSGTLSPSESLDERAVQLGSGSGMPSPFESYSYFV
jgi:hypothetical protein